MSQYEIYSLVISAVGTLIIAAGLYFTFRQLRLVNEQIKLTVDQAKLLTEQTRLLAEQSRIELEAHSDNHEWNRRYSTQETLMRFTLGGYVDNLVASVVYQDRNSPVPIKELQDLFKENPRLESECLTLLNYYEGLARGIRFGIYDEEIVKAARRGPMRRTHTIFREYIAYWRSWNLKSWNEFEALTNRWEEKGQLPQEGRQLTGKLNITPN